MARTLQGSALMFTWMDGWEFNDLTGLQLRVVILRVQCQVFRVNCQIMSLKKLFWYTMGCKIEGSVHFQGESNSTGHE